MKRILLLLGLFLLLALVESQGRRDGRRFPLRTRSRQNAAPQQAESEKESSPAETVSEVEESPKTVVEPRRPARRRPGGLRRRPYSVRQPRLEEANKSVDEEIPQDDKLLSVPTPPKQSSRRGLRVRIPKRPKVQPKEIPLEPSPEKEKKMDVIPKKDIMETKPETLDSKISKPFPLLKAEKKSKKDMEQLVKEEIVKVDAKDIMESPVKSPVKFRPLSIKIPRGGIKKSSKKESKSENEKLIDEPTAPAIESKKETDSPKKEEESSHRFAGRVRPPLRSRHRGRGRVHIPMVSTPTVAVPEEMEKPETPVEPQKSARRRNQPRISRKRPSSRKQEVLPVEEIQEEPVQVVEEEVTPLEVAPEQLDKRFPNPFELMDLLVREEQKTTSLPSVSTTGIPPSRGNDEEARFSTIHKIPEEREAINIHEDDFLVESTVEVASTTTEDPLQDIPLDPFEFLLSKVENIPLDYLTEEEVTSVNQRAPDDVPSHSLAKESEIPRRRFQARNGGAQTPPVKPSGRIRISRKRNKPKIEEPTGVPILLAEDPQDAKMPRTYPVRSYGSPDITFKGGDVVITEIGTRENTPRHQVRTILSGLGSRRRGLARPHKTKAHSADSQLPQPDSQNSKGKVIQSALITSDLDPDIDYDYDYYDDLYDYESVPIQ